MASNQLQRPDGDTGTYLRTYVLTYLCTCVLAYLRTCVLAYLRKYGLVCLRTYVLPCLRTYVLTYLRTYVLMCLYALTCLWPIRGMGMDGWKAPSAPTQLTSSQVKSSPVKSSQVKSSQVKSLGSDLTLRHGDGHACEGAPVDGSGVKGSLKDFKATGPLRPA